MAVYVEKARQKEGTCAVLYYQVGHMSMRPEGLKTNVMTNLWSSWAALSAKFEA